MTTTPADSRYYLFAAMPDTFTAAQKNDLIDRHEIEVRRAMRTLADSARPVCARCHLPEWTHDLWRCVPRHMPEFVGDDDMRREVVLRELNQGALAGFDSRVTEQAVDLVLAVLNRYDAWSADRAAAARPDGPRTDTGPEQPDDTAPRCAHCTHPRSDHSDRRDHTPSSLRSRRPWCHACDTTCDYDPARPDNTNYDRRLWDMCRRDAGCDCTAPDPADCEVEHGTGTWWSCVCHAAGRPDDTTGA